MTIGYILDDTLDRSDGVQQAMIATAEAMRERGHDVHYIVPYTERTDLANIHQLSRTIALKFNGNSVRTPLPARRKSIRALFNDVQFDILHVQMPYSPLMAARVIKCAPRSTAVIGTFHILPYSRFVSVGTWVLGRLLRRANRRILKAYAVSQPALEFMQSHFGLMGSVLGNPVDYTFFQSYAKAAKKTKKRIVFVGRFDERKGVMHLLNAYEQLPERHHVELVMCGKGPLWDEVARQNHERGLGIVLPGFVSEQEKAEYLASATIAVYPSTGGESFGIVLTEAMSAGAGVTLGGNNPGYASVLGEWPETLFDPTNTAVFAILLNVFLNDDQKRTHVGQLQHESVKQFDIKYISNELERAYASCILQAKSA